MSKLASNISMVVVGGTMVATMVAAVVALVRLQSWGVDPAAPPALLQIVMDVFAW